MARAAAASHYTSRSGPTRVAAAGSTPTPGGSAETTAATTTRAPHAGSAGAALRRPDDAVKPTGAAHRSVSPAGARAAALANSTAAARTAPRSLDVAGATAATSAGTGAGLTSGSAQAESVGGSADWRDAKTATAAPRTAATRGRAHHRAATAGCTGNIGFAGRRTPIPAAGAQDRSVGGAAGAAHCRRRAGVGGTVDHR